MINAPSPELLAPTISLLLSKYANVGAPVISDFSLSDAFCCGFPHTNATSLWVSCEKAVVD